MAKVGTHVEDLIFRLYELYTHYRFVAKDATNVGNAVKVQGSNVHTGTSGTADVTKKKEQPAKPDVMMDVHHIATAVLCILSYYSGEHAVHTLSMKRCFEERKIT